jgi:hypothetical protein
MNFLSGKWSFYVNGTLIAVFVILCLYLFNDNIGMGDGMLVISEFCNQSIRDKAIDTPPELDWQTGFLGGILIGALGASIISGNWKIRIFPEKEGGIITTAWKSVVFGIGGGFLVMLGLQLSGDSFWGQWASAIQLSAGAWIFLISTFVVATLTSIMLERRGESSEDE